MSTSIIQKSTWYLNRLTSMSFAEIVYRLQQQYVEISDRRNWRRISNSTIVKNIDILDCFYKTPFFFELKKRSELATTIYQDFPDNITATILQADALCKYEISIFNHNFKYKVTDQINWQTDPLTGKAWPHRFYADIDTRDGISVGGVKWVWELNRHHQFVTLGKAYWLTGNEKYALEVCDQWQSWINNNPPFTGVNWTSSLELALRLINWTWTLAFICTSSALTSSLLQKILQSIEQQATYISRHMAEYSSANNHLIGEAAGLAIVGLSFPFLPQAESWRESGFTILEREIEYQILPDGVPAEQAVSYLAFILDFNLMVWRLAEINGFKSPSIWYERLGVASDFISSIIDENGNVPAIGDSDDAWVVRLDDRAEANNYQSILASAAVILHRPDLKAPIAGLWDEKSYWLLGEGGRQTFQQLSSTTQVKVSHSFKVGGYTIMRAPGRVITLDHGFLGYLSTAAHGHADALSLTVHLNGSPFLIDPGTYAYQEGNDWRDYYRSTAAHNTVTVEGQNQSEIQGSFLWGKKANAELCYWQKSPEVDICIAWQDGYVESFDVTHQRLVFFYKPDWLIVIDSLLGNDNRNITQWWHFSPTCKVVNNEGFLQIKANDRKYRMWVEAKNGLGETAVSPPSISVHQGELNPIQGWASSYYGSQEPAPAVAVSGNFRLPAKLTAVFCFKELVEKENIELQKKQILRSCENAIQEVQN